MSTHAVANVCTDFSVFNKAVNARFAALSEGELFVTDATDAIYDQYLAAFPSSANPIFRTRTLYDCQTCKRFIRRLGKLVALEGGKVRTVWEDLDLPEPFRTVAEKLDALVKSSKVVSVFRTKERQFGAEYNYDPKTNERYDHFMGLVAARHHSRDAETERGEQNAIFQVLRRGLTEIRQADLETVIDLIESNGLYRGDEHKPAVLGFMQVARDFRSAGASDLFVWENLGHRFARFRNTVIGTLLVELAEGKELEHAVKSFETKVAPTNYKRPTAIITQRMVETALQTLTELGLYGAINRRFARLSDVSVNDVLFVDNEAQGQLKDGVAALLEGHVKRSTPDVKKAVSISMDAFLSNILPGTKKLEVFLENRHQGNFVSLTGADGPERLFKWNNNFAWSYDGDITDSVKQRVKAAGGNINALMRVSLSWFNFDDLDLHAVTPSRNHIFYANKCGILDVDMNACVGRTRNAVENLAFNKLEDGEYSIYVNQFSRRETIDVGFAIEVEFGGVIHQYSYGKGVVGDVPCFKLKAKGGTLIGIESPLQGGATSQDKWGVKTETLVPVTAAMLSPNHWGSNNVGAKHLILALKNCKNPNAVRGIYNEFLRSDLEKHRKVFEVLGAKSKCAPAEDQISGVGFTAARGDSVTVVADHRAFTITF